jgi:hypothetical protein
MDKTVQNYMKKDSKLFQVRKKLEVGHNSCDVKGQHVILFRQSSEQNNRKLISLHNNVEDEKHAHGFGDF